MSHTPPSANSNNPTLPSGFKGPVATPASHVYFSQRLRLHYIDWGNPQAPTMVLVHGIHDHCRTWDDLVAQFADRYHVIAPDLRGHGDSAWVQGSAYHYLDYLYDLHQLVLQAEVAPVVLVGHSMGGAIAALFAGVYPDLVERLIVIEGIGLWRAAQPPQPVQDSVREWIDATRQLAGRAPRKYPLLEDALHRMQQANPQLSEEQARHLTVHGSNRNEDGTFSWKYDNYTYNFSPAGFSTEETTALWQQVTAPVLIMNADGGMEHRIGHDETAGYFQHATCVDISDAGHWTYHDQLMEVTAQIQDFLRA